MTHVTGGEATIVFAFLAGLASFISPCVLPVLPAYLAHLAGTTLDRDEVDRFSFFRSALLFVLGFTLVFALLGVLLNSFLESVAGDLLLWLSRAAGLVIIVFGLHLTGLININTLNREISLPVDRLEGLPFASFLFGAAFAVGWTPCVGPILGSIFTLAAVHPTSAFFMLFSYGIGLGIPFLLIGLFPFRATDYIQAHRDTFHTVQVVFGYVLIALGVMVFTMNLSLIANFGLLNEVLLS